MLKLPINLVRSLRAINYVLKNRSVALVHSNTLAVLSGAIWARLHRVPHLWHVHEIIVHPIFVRKIYANLLNLFANSVVCVSNATKENLLQDCHNLINKTQVVWNGLACEKHVETEAVLQFRNLLRIQKGELILVLAGRINRLKGQILLTEAAGILWNQGFRNLRFIFVGSVVPGQEQFLQALQDAINISPARDRIVHLEFIHNIWPILIACDIVVIPSTEPESFGMVALEAMAVSKPVIATDHGGVSEIIIQGETGLLVPPKDVQALVDAIKKLAIDENLGHKMGSAGLQRCLSEFTLEGHVSKMTKLYELTMNKET
jgi:glycosyltransferase involved in cell wall biosynthesis